MRRTVNVLNNTLTFEFQKLDNGWFSARCLEAPTETLIFGSTIESIEERIIKSAHLFIKAAS